MDSPGDTHNKNRGNLKPMILFRKLTKSLQVFNILHETPPIWRRKQPMKPPDVQVRENEATKRI